MIGKKFILITLVALVPFFSIAQKEDFYKLLKSADVEFRYDNYEGALPLYLQALEINDRDPMVNFRVGICYLNDLSYKATALEYFLVAEDVDKKIDEHFYYYLGVAYQYNHEFEDALESYELALENVDETEPLLLEDIKKRMEQCKNGIQQLENPVDVVVENLGPMINSEYADYAPVISADETVMAFTSKRKGSRGGKRDHHTGEYHEDIYISYKKDGEWSTPENIGKTVNTHRHDATLAMSPDGRTLFVYSSDNNGDILISEFIDSTWTEPVSIGDNINTLEYKENSVSISPDEKTLFFTSDRPGGQGGMDIYMSKKDASGKWQDPVNLGPLVNSELDEEGPFISSDGRTLYFSSNGHPGIGGFDIFFSDYDEEGGVWLEPHNIGYPINTADDDIFFVFNADGLNAYFSSAREDSYGNKDIYVLKRYEKAEIEAILKAEVVGFYEGEYNDTLKPVPATIILMDKKSNKFLGIYNTQSSGKFTAELKPGKTYHVKVTSTGFETLEQDIVVPPKKEVFTIHEKFELQPLKEDK